MLDAFNKSGIASGFRNLIILNLSPGSIKTDYKVEFASVPGQANSEQDILKSLKTNGDPNILPVDKEKISVKQEITG